MTQPGPVDRPILTLGDFQAWCSWCTHLLAVVTCALWFSWFWTLFGGCQCFTAKEVLHFV